MPPSPPPTEGRLISLYSSSLWKKMPRGHVSLNSFITPLPAEPTGPPPPLNSPSHCNIQSSHLCTDFLKLAPFPFWCISRPQTAATHIAALAERLQRLALTSGNAPCRVPAHQSDPFQRVSVSDRSCSDKTREPVMAPLNGLEGFKGCSSPASWKLTQRIIYLFSVKNLNEHRSSSICSRSLGIFQHSEMMWGQRCPR